MTEVPGQVSAFPCCCPAGFLAHGQLSQATLSMSSAVTKSPAEPLQSCLQRLHKALPLPAFKGPLLLLLCHLREWQDPAHEALSHFAELSRWQHPILTMAELRILQTLKCSVSQGLLYKGKGLLCTSLAKAFREPRKKEKTNKNFQKYLRKPVPKSPWMCIHD